MSERKRSQTRFVLRDVKENEIRDENGYDIFGPTVSLKVDGKNVFERFGISGVERPVIMHSLENFLRETLKLVQKLNNQPRSEHRYWFLGTGFGLKLRREGTSMALILDTDFHYGPRQASVKDSQSSEVGRVTVREWVQSIVTFSANLLTLYKRFNPRIYSSLKQQELQTQELRDWLASSG